jgi:hypothetical protein
MRFLRTARVVVMSLAALAAGAACSSHVSEGGSETNWLCGIDADCASGQVCVRKKCQAAGDASAAGSGDPLQGRSTTLFTDVVRIVGEPVANCAPGQCMNGMCLSVALQRDATGHTPCSVIDVAEQGSGCNPAMGLGNATPNEIATVLPQLRERGMCDVLGAPPCATMNLCERMEATGTALQSCLNDATVPADSFGWCYIDPENGVGSAAIVDKCQAEQRLLRFPPVSVTHTLVFACFSSHATPAPSAAGTGKIGDPFVPEDETRTDFNGYSASEVNIENRSPSCESGIGLVYGFSGRTGCPYGQPPDKNDPTHVDPTQQTCFTPSGEPVTVLVRAQHAARPPSKAVYCSCRCDGPDTNASYCTCPNGFECKPLVNDYGFGSEQLAGSYCIKAGTAYSPSPSQAPCDVQTLQCGPVRP